MSFFNHNRVHKFKEEDLKRILKLDELEFAAGEYVLLLNGINGYMNNIDELANYLSRNWVGRMPNLKLFEIIKLAKERNNASNTLENKTF